MARPKRQTPWLKQRDNAFFYAEWYDETARRVRGFSLRTTDAGEAKTRFAAFLLNEGEFRQPRDTGEITIARALDDYMAEHVYKNCAAARRQGDAVRHLKTWFGDQPLSAVTVPTSRGYAEARYAGVVGGGSRRKDKSGSPGTVRRELNVLVAAANHAVWMGRTKLAIAVDLPAEKRLGPDDEAPYLDRDELDALFAAAEAEGGEMRLFVPLLYWTGARRKSIEDLTRKQVKLREKRIILQQPGKVATKKRQPIVPILTPMVPIVEELMATGGRERLFACADFYRPFTALCERVGIEEGRRHPHILRHSRATHLLQDGKTLYDVARLLGDTISTVEGVYGHHSADHLASRLE